MRSTLYTFRYVYENPHTGVRWTDGQDTHNVQTAKALKRGSLGTVEAVLAHHYKVHFALQKAASQFYMRAATNMARHRDTGAAHVGMGKGDLDWSVYLEDSPGEQAFGPETRYARKKSALSIELGHRIRGSDRRVGGLFILSSAADAMARKPGKEW